MTSFLVLGVLHREKLLSYKRGVTSFVARVVISGSRTSWRKAVTIETRYHYRYVIVACGVTSGSHTSWENAVTAESETRNDYRYVTVVCVVISDSR